MNPPEQTIQEATTCYEAWMASRFEITTADLEYKHAKMADAVDAFPFFRGTYYRWAQWWPLVCPELCDVPIVLAIGDLHLENFGNWRDSEGRLCWGVNDFDEADELPFTHDLVRLAASLRFATLPQSMDVKFKQCCAAILEGYTAALKVGGDPFVLEEQHLALRTLAMSADRDPALFWKKLTKALGQPAVEPPATAMTALLSHLPDTRLKPEYRYRQRVGMGSLGRPRYVALVEWAGGWLAREAKAMLPPVTSWLAGKDSPTRMAEIVTNAHRAPDPFYRPGPDWISRRLAPRCSRIDLAQLTAIGDVTLLFRSMGEETANIHLGSDIEPNSLLGVLEKLPAEWLPKAAKAMAGCLLADWKAYPQPH